MRINKWFMACLMVMIGVCTLVSERAQAQELATGDYITISTVYNGKRYYLGTDTVKAKDGTPTYVLKAYEEPSYATMWQVGTPSGRARMLKSVWLAEKVSQNKYLTLGTNKSTYSELGLNDTTYATMWTTAKDEEAQSKYMEGYVYYFSDATGVDIYRYLSYDPLFGFSRAFSTRPMASQRVTAWDRKTGNDLLFTFAPVTHTFGLEMSKDTTILPVTSKVTYYKDVDRFRSREGKIDVFAKEPTIITDPATLTGAPYYLYGYYEWKSNPRVSAPTYGADTYDGGSKMKVWGTKYVLKPDAKEPYESEDFNIVTGWMDSTVMAVRIEKFQRGDDGLWHDTLYAIGTSPFDIYGMKTVDEELVPDSTKYRDHSDWLYIKFTCEGQTYKDSAYLVRQTFHRDPYTTLTIKSTPEDHTFPYKYTGGTGDQAISQESDTAMSFSVSGRYTAGGRILYTNGTVAQTIIAESGDVDIPNLPKEAIGDHEYNTLKVEALMANGKSAIVGAEDADANAWIESVRLTDKSTVRVHVTPFAAASTKSRTAQLRISYNYLHSTAVGDTALAARSIWITQAGASGAGIYDFNHKGSTTTPQAVHTKVQDMYGIPGQALGLPVHRDHWGYYRWYQWDYTGGANEVAVNNNTWSWVMMPQNNNGDELMPINNVTSATSRGHWDVGKGYLDGHYTAGTPTPIPSVTFPADAALNFVDSLACDVSAYTNIMVTPEGTLGTDELTSITEPTLSYRNIFAIKHASVRADEMSKCRTTGDREEYRKWMEEHDVVVPAGRTFTLTPRCPVSDNDEGVEEGHLQYIYYFNTAGTMGTEDSLDKTKAASYNRIGRAKYASDRTVNLLTRAAIKSMENNTSKQVVMVNPRKDGKGYVFGYSASGFGTQQEWLKNVTTKAQLDNAIKTKVVDAEQNGYILTLTKKNGKITISYGNTPLYLNQESLFSGSWTVEWGKKAVAWSNEQWEFDHIDLTAQTDWSTHRANMIDATNLESSVVSLYIAHSAWFGIVQANGYLNACTYEDPVFTPSPHFIDDEKYAGDLVNVAWIFYEVQAPGALQVETPQWKKYNTSTSTWEKVADETNSNNVAGYRMLPNGSLEISESVLLNANETIQYQLVTDNFQLAKFTVLTRSAAEEGPSDLEIIPEETLINDYDILYDFSMDGFVAPGSTDQVASTNHMDWTNSEMSFHYPLGSIGAANRVNTHFLPGKGEYAFINKFDTLGTTLECLSGAKYGYMLCANASEKPVKMMIFEYDNPPCADQQIYLTGYICNPVNNEYEPLITADMDGWDGSAWIPIYRYKTGNIPYNSNHPWYQFVLPLDRAKIAGYSKFRCTATLTGSTNADAYVLMDRLRFVANARPLTVFQNKTTCLSGSNVDIVARLDYKNSTYPEGMTIAYQFQKYNTSTTNYDPMPTTGTHHVTYPHGIEDIDGAACGYITIPAADFTPGASDTATYDNLKENSIFYINEGTGSAKYWVMMLTQTVTDAAKNDQYRVAMAAIPTTSTRPNFSTANCAAERILTIKSPVTLKVGDHEWHNATREQAAAQDTLKAPNNTYRLMVKVSSGVDGATNEKCKFDALSSYVEDRDYEAKVRAMRGYGGHTPTHEDTVAVTTADASFKTKYGVTRNQILEILEIFRADNEENPLREETNWNNVRAEDFRWSGRSMEQATQIYNTLDNMIKNRVLQIGLDYLDIYLGNNEDAYYYIQPMPATGKYTKGGDEVHFPVCNTPQWFEIHSKNPTDHYSLRFGIDHEVDGNYAIPVIRATKTAATTGLKVKIANMASSNDENTIVLGWQGTQLAESNDPNWTGSETVKYQQDKDVRTHKPSEVNYAEGEDITFTPMAGNAFALKDGYWYRFSSAFYYAPKETTYSAADVPETLAGHAEFILAIAPDTVVWSPSHPESSNYWNDDDNWVAKNGTADMSGCIATIPMGDTKVIIPAPTQENMLPIVNDIVMHDVETYDYGFTKNTCHDILFKPNARMIGQENLTYTRAFVDVTLKTGRWKTFTPAIDHVYSGDIYIPAKVEKDKDFEPLQFENRTVEGETGTDWSADHNRTWPYVFYQGHYNATVPCYFNNTDEEGNPLRDYEKSSADWLTTNTLAQYLAPGTASVLLGYGPSETLDSTLIVRLPKNETTYTYIDRYGTTGGTTAALSHTEDGVAVHKPNLAGLSTNLSFDRRADGSKTYTISGSTASTRFFFGNPTMALLDVYLLCHDEANRTEFGAGPSYTVYQLTDWSSYTTRTVTAEGQYYIAPQEAVGLVGKSSTSHNVVLKPSMLKAMTGEAASAPRRRALAQEQSAPKYLYIAASNMTDDGEYKAFMTLGESENASRAYKEGEDALAIMSGVNYYNAASLATPLSIYTITENQALMQDVRDSLSSMPLVFNTLDDHYEYSDITYMSFATEGEWDTPLYLYDALTNDSILIVNGLKIGIQTPESDQIRYFINGRRMPQTTEQTEVTTDSENVTVNGDRLAVSGTEIYDLLGRKIMTLSEYELLSNINLPTGVYIVRFGDKSERRIVR